MPRSMVRFTTSRSKWNPQGLRFVEGDPDPSDKGGGAPPSDDPPADDPPADDPPADDPPGADQLGDAGKKALDAMKADRNKAREELRNLRSEFEQFRAKAEGREKEWQAEQDRQKVKDEAIAAANDRILKAELRATATGKLADPQDALRFLDLSEFEVGSDGDVDTDALSAAIDDLVKTKPYLAAQGDKRFKGGADGGARKESRPAQLTRDDLSRMTPDQINEARSKGQLDDLLGVESR